MDEAPIKRTQAYWDLFFLEMADRVALLSKDPDRQVGAVLASPDRRQFSLGFNGFPPDVPDLPSLLADKALKNERMVHAEDNCLRQAPFNPYGCSLYLTRFPCLPCATKIVANGVARLVMWDDSGVDFDHPRWGKSWAQAERHLRNANVYMIAYSRR